MPFPSPTLAPPALSFLQLSYGGLAFGGLAAGSTYQLQSLNIDMPGIAGGDVQRAIDLGEFAGQRVLPGRDITVVQAIRAPTALALDQAVQALGGVLGPTGATEAPLYLQLASGTFVCMARPAKHNCPIDLNRVQARGTVATTLFHATDPRWYAAPSRTATVGLPAPLGGLQFPASFPASFGGGGSGGILTAVNAGGFETRPVFIITGPCTKPTVQNLSLPGAPQLSFALQMAVGDTLTIDTDWRTVIYTTAGSTQASSRRNALQPGSTWFNLQPGASQIEFTTADGTQVPATLTVQSADAYLSL